MEKKIIVISAINFTEGGTLSVLNDCLDYLSEYLTESYKIIALVHSNNLFTQKNIEFREFPKSKKSWLFRLYYEYYFFNKLSLQIKPFLWLSLHDSSPNVHAEIKAVYCHNPSIFYKLNFSEVLWDIKFSLFNLLYKYVYQINIKKNDFVLVQQQWIRNEFSKRFNLPLNKIIVAKPSVKEILVPTFAGAPKSTTTFFYPALGRIFKNFEVILKACQVLEDSGQNDFEVILTIDGSENRYTRSLIKKYNGLKCVKFTGVLSRNKVYELYNKCDCLIFPSKLETWGLPITEFKAFNKPILLVDLPYAKETLGHYGKVSFFEPDSFQELSFLMSQVKNGNPQFVDNKALAVDAPYSDSWADMFNLILGHG